MFPIILEFSRPLWTVFEFDGALARHQAIFELAFVNTASSLHGAFTIKIPSCNLTCLFFVLWFESAFSFRQIVRVVSCICIPIFPYTESLPFLQIVLPLAWKCKCWQLHCSKPMLQVVPELTFEVIFLIGESNFTLPVFQASFVSTYVDRLCIIFFNSFAMFQIVLPLSSISADIRDWKRSNSVPPIVWIWTLVHCAIFINTLTSAMPITVNPIACVFIVFASVSADAIRNIVF